MITEQQQEQASLYVLGTLTADERQAFEAEVRANSELRGFVHGLQRTTLLLAMASPAIVPPPELRDKVLRLVEGGTPAIAPLTTPPLSPGFRFLEAGDREGWRPLPVPGAFIKLLSLERERGYAVLLGKLDPGVRYPAHTNVGPESFYILTGDLHIGHRRMGPGDFHHAEAGSQHGVNHSVDGCTLIAVLSTDDPLVELAMS